VKALSGIAPDVHHKRHDCLELIVVEFKAAAAIENPATGMAVDLQPKGRRSGRGIMCGCLGQTHLTSAQPTHCGDPASASLRCEQKADIGAYDTLFDKIRTELKGAKAKLLLGTGKHRSILQKIEKNDERD
jgi:hypothetical protein